jgi:hypothetical protein
LPVARGARRRNAALSRRQFQEARGRDHQERGDSCSKGLKARQLRRSPIALGAIEIRHYCMIVSTAARLIV